MSRKFIRGGEGSHAEARVRVSGGLRCVGWRQGAHYLGTNNVDIEEEEGWSLWIGEEQAWVAGGITAGFINQNNPGDYFKYTSDERLARGIYLTYRPVNTVPYTESLGKASKKNPLYRDWRTLDRVSGNHTVVVRQGVLYFTFVEQGFEHIYSEVPIYNDKLERLLTIRQSIADNFTFYVNANYIDGYRRNADIPPILNGCRHIFGTFSLVANKTHLLLSDIKVVSDLTKTGLNSHGMPVYSAASRFSHSFVNTWSWEDKAFYSYDISFTETKLFRYNEVIAACTDGFIAGFIIDHCSTFIKYVIDDASKTCVEQWRYKLPAEYLPDRFDYSIPFDYLKHEYSAQYPEDNQRLFSKFAATSTGDIFLFAPRDHHIAASRDYVYVLSDSRDYHCLDINTGLLTSISTGIRTSASRTAWPYQSKALCTKNRFYYLESATEGGTVTVSAYSIGANGALSFSRSIDGVYSVNGFYPDTELL